jgi:hypothetical protein
VNLLRYAPEIIVAILFIAALLGYSLGLSANMFVVLFVLLLVLATSIALFSSGLKSWLFLRRLRITPVSTTGSSKTSIVSINGRAKSSKPLMSPISSVPCAYWRVTAECTEPVPSGTEVWTIESKKIYSADSRTPFFIEDDTGRLLIDPQGAEMDIHCKEYNGYISGHGLSDEKPATMDERVIRFIESLDNKEQQDFRAHDFFTIAEYYLPEDETLYVLGRRYRVNDAANPGDPETFEIKQGVLDLPVYFADSTFRLTVKNHSRTLYTRIFLGMALTILTLYAFSVYYS